MVDTDDTDSILPLIAKAKHFTPAEVESFISRPVKPLFVYGTNMIPAVLARVIDDVEGPVSAEEVQKWMTPATLYNFESFARKDFEHPAVLNGFRGSSVSGLVIFALTAAQQDCIGDFEGGLYSRETHNVKVQLISEEFRIIEADVYVWVGDRGQLYDPDEEAWSFEEFLENDYNRECLPIRSSMRRTNRKLFT